MASTPKSADATSDKPEIAEPLGHAAIDRRGDPKGSGAVKTAVKRSDFNLHFGLSSWTLSDVDEWSKLTPSRHEAAKEDITKWKQLTEQEKKKLLRQDKSSRRQIDQRDYSEAIRDATQEKEAAKQQQRELEERKKLLEASENSQAELIQLEQEIKEAKEKQERCQQQINSWKEGLQKTFQQQDEESKRFLEKALRKGHILVRMTKCIFTGYAGAGKTSLLCLLLGVKLPTVRCSTPCAESPIRVVSGTRIQLLGEGWVKVSIKDLEEMLASYIPILCDTVPDEVVPSEVHESLFQQQQSSGVTQDKAAPTSQGQATPTSQGSPLSTSQDQTTSSISDAPKQATTSLLDDLLKRLNQLAMESTEGSEESSDFTNANWIHLIDSGGQPQFYDLLPIFIRHTSSIVLVQRLCDCLNEHPIVEYYDEEGNPIGTSYHSLFTNLEILMCLTRAMHSHPTEGKYPKIMLACTHRDMEEKCSQKRGEKNQTLFKLLHPLFRKDLILYGDAMEPIFPLNTREPDEEDRRVAKLLRQAIESSASDPVKIPLWWYFLEIALGRLAAMLHRRILSRNECLGIARHFRFSEEEFDAALRYYDELNVCLYYPYVLPDVVFSDPQVPLDKASELVQYSYKLQEGKQGRKSEGPQEALEAEWLKFRDQGIIQLQFLEKFPQHYRDGIFMPADLLKLFKHLLIFAPLTKDEYFMPSLLQMLPPEELDKHRAPSSSPAAPLVIHFPHGWPRSGIFCCLVVYLINCCKWQICRQSGLPILVARNCIKFALPSCPCIITLIDSFAQFEVHVNSPAEVCCEICPIIRHKIFDGIDAAAATLRYNNARPHPAFFCTHTPKESEKTTLHIATLSEDCKWCICTEDDVFRKLNEKQTVWFDSADATSASGTVSTPQRRLCSPLPPNSPTSKVDTLAEKDLIKITDYLLDMEKIQIYNLGLVLGLRHSKLKTMMDSATFCDDVIASWLRKEDQVAEKGEPSWTVLVDALKHRRVGQTGIANNIAKDHLGKLD